MRKRLLFPDTGNSAQGMGVASRCWWGMKSVTTRIERALWALALAIAAIAIGVVAWRREPAVRILADGFIRRATAAQTLTPVGIPPESGPVRLPTCRGNVNERDPWLLPGAHGPDLGALAALSADVEQRRWTWEDVNTVPIIRWDGDTRVVKPGSKGRVLTVRGDIDVTRALAMERAFGYEIDHAVIRYGDDAELVSKRASLDDVLAVHGVQRRRTQEGDVLSPNYEWMVSASLDDVRPLARAILAEARRRGASGLRDEFGAFVSFIQQLKYGNAPDPGDTKHRFGLSMPLWCLATATGDCDTRAVLLVALTRSIGLCEVHLVRDADHQHMLAAAAIPVREGDRLVRPNGRTFVLVETTDDWPIGHVAVRTRGERLQTLFLADVGGSFNGSKSAAQQQPSTPQPISMRAQRTAPVPSTSGRSTPARSRQ